MKSIRFLALLLCAALLLPLVPVHAAQSGGSFYLTASTAGQTLIEPVAVPYTAGQTIRDALRGSGYAFGGIDTAFITDIEGVAGNFTVYYDGGAYSLDAIASPETVTAVVFSERERGFPALLDAVTELGRFRERTDHVQNYPAAQQAYAAALSGLRTADETGLTTLLAALRSAVAEYEAILNGTKYPVTFTDTAGTAAQLTLTDSYGNVTQVQGLRAEVVAGEYTFSLSDGGANRVDGTLTVAGAVEKQVALPTGDWFGTIRLHNASGASAGAYPGTQDDKTHTAQFRVEDFRTLAYLYAERGVDAPADAALYSCYTGQNGKDYGDGSQPSNRKSWSSYQTALVSLLTAGMTDCEVRLEARSASGADTRIQSYMLRLHRVPTLASLAVYGEGTRLPLDFDPAGTDYAVTTVSEDRGGPVRYGGLFRHGERRHVRRGPRRDDHGAGSPHERRAHRLYHCGDEGRLRRGADHGARGNGHCRLQCGGQRDRARRQRDLPPHPRRALYLDHDKAGILSCGGQL